MFKGIKDILNWLFRNEKDSLKKILVILLMGLGISGLAQKRYTISGTVYNNTDIADLLIGVHVVYEAGKGAVTDISGKYKLELLPGAYSITYSYVGFESVTKEVELTNRDQIIDVGETQTLITTTDQESRRR